MRLEPYPAETLTIREGPLLDLERKKLRKEGKAAQADNPDLSVEFETSGLRTIYSDPHDHHPFVGKVLDVAPIRLRPEFRGWRLTLECLPDDVKTGRTLPLYVFSAALAENYVPKRGDLVQGAAWLQGRWVEQADDAERDLWRERNGPLKE